MDRRSLIFVILLTACLFFVNRWFFQSPEPAPSTMQPVEAVQEEPFHLDASSTAPIKAARGGEEFYVLENEYQQIVFSNQGGAIAEINLPFHTKENPASFVRPIQFDRIYAKDFSFNDHFPAFPYYINRGSGIEKIDTCQVGGYYPLLRRALIPTQNAKNIRIPNKHYALNFTSESFEPGNFYTLKRLEKDLIEFESVESERKVSKIFRFPENPTDAPYCLEVFVKIDGDARGLWMTSGIPEVELISDNPAPALKYTIINNKQKVQMEELSLPKECTTLSSVAPNWVCSSNGFFGLILDPLTPLPAGIRGCKIPGTDDPTRLTLIDAQYQLYPADKYPGYSIMIPMTSKTMQFRYYAGPLEGDILKRVDETFTDPATGGNPQYIAALSFHGWFTFISEPFAKFLFILMEFFYKITSSWGISIILLTIALRIMLYPLNAWSIKSTVKMQEVAPKVAAIQEKYKKDPKRAQLEIMTLYREKGVNPLSGCFPLLIQLPFLIGMFDLLKSTFELRGASFIPGWINNLTAPDVVFSWNYPIFFFGTNFHLLPFLLGGVMWFQQRFSSAGSKDKSMMTDQQKQQRMMGNIMTIVFTVMFYHFPSGLNIYWLSSMALGILQQWFMQRKMKMAKK